MTGGQERCGTSSRAASRSRAVVQAVASSMEPTSLDAVMEVAGLQTRVDRKYLLTAEQFAALADDLEGRFHALEIDGRRTFDYESTYFDSADLALFRAHRQGRRRRYKVRTRSYLDSGECLFEVKLEGSRDQTVKHRLPYDIDARERLDDKAQRFLERVLHTQYRVGPPELAPVLATRYDRTTLVDLLDGARLTCDVGLQCRAGERQVSGPDQVIVESKTTGSGVADRALAARGVRAVKLSKYCVGVALLNPELAANRWDRLLRREFGWERRTAPAAQCW